MKERSQKETPENKSQVTDAPKADEIKQPELEVKEPEIKGEQAPATEPVLKPTPPGSLAVQVDEEDEYTVNIIKDYDGKIDVFHLNNADPKFQYRFLRIDDKNLVSKTGNVLFQKGGWQIVPKKHLEGVMKMKSRELAPDGTYRVGDLVLARMPKDLYKEKLEYKKKQADGRTNTIQRMIKDGDPEGESGIHDSMKGIQTKKALKM